MDNKRLNAMETSSDRRSRAALAARKAVVLLLSFVLAAGAFLFVVPEIPAFADSRGDQAQQQWSQPGYANEVMTGDSSDRGGWGTNVFNEITDAPEDASGEDFVSRINDVSSTVATTLMWVLLIMTVFRFALRGIVEMISRQKNGQDREFPFDRYAFIRNFIMVGQERKSNKLQSEWVVPMLKSTFIIWLVVFAVWFVFSLLAGIALFALNSVTSSGNGMFSGS